MNRDEIGELENGSGRLFLLTWRIPNIMSLCGSIGSSYYWSPNFYFLNFCWALGIKPNDRVKGDIGFYLDRRSNGPPQAVNCTVGMRNVDGVLERLIHLTNTFSDEAPSRGTSKFLHRADFVLRKSELLPSEILTIVCTLWTNVEDERLTSSGEQTKDLADGVAKEEVYARLNSKGGATLRKHFQDLLLNGNDHDVTLKVKDQQFKAHKNILRARSPVFDAMFAHSMAENESGEVYIEDCDPNAFFEFLKYVYVGKFENISAATAAGLYYIADKYDFPDVKEACVEFLKSGVTPNVICDVVPLAMNHGEDELLECAMDFFANHMVETFMTEEWQRFVTVNPLLANELNIKALNYSTETVLPFKKRKYV